jgi:hypothetical protein
MDIRRSWRLLAAAGLGVAVGSILTSAGSGGATPFAAAPRPPAGLTAHGKIVWQLDALLHDTFGHRKVCVGPSPTVDFQLRCSPSSDFNQYLPTFSSARRSTWRLSSASPSSLVLGTFETVQVRGLYVRCRPGFWLVSLGTGLIPFICSPPS